MAKAGYGQLDATPAPIVVHEAREFPQTHPVHAIQHKQQVHVSRRIDLFATRLALLIGFVVDQLRAQMSNDTKSSSPKDQFIRRSGQRWSTLRQFLLPQTCPFLLNLT
jgi:hypothetical protein